jgi:hypothetical protein
MVRRKDQGLSIGSQVRVALDGFALGVQELEWGHAQRALEVDADRARFID